MKNLMSLVVIALLSTSTFAVTSTTNRSADVNAMAAAWKHQNPVAVGNNNLTMVGGQDISSRTMLDGPISAA